METNKYKQARVVILILDETGFKAQSITKDKDRFHNDIMYQEDKTIIRVYVPNNRDLK